MRPPPSRSESLAIALAAGALAWWLCPSRFWSDMSWRAILAIALGYVAIVFEGTVLFGRLAGWVLRRRFDPLAGAESTIWMAPLAVLASARSAWAPLVTMLLAGALTVRFGFRIGGSAMQALSAHGAGLALQAMIAAVAIGWNTAAAGLAVLGAFLFAARWADDHEHPRAMWRTLAAATLLAAIGLLQYHLARGGPDNEGSAYAAAPPPKQEPTAEAMADTVANAKEFDDSHIGVILLPELQPHTMLIAPLPALGRGWKPARDPLSIPFFGAYWYYKPPHGRPPPRSHVVRGKASETSFRSADRRPLRMEARQNLGVFFDVNCCRELRIDVSNADRFPGSVELEASLNDSVRLTSIGLGRKPVLSTPRWRPGDDGGAIAETVRFPMPGTPARFDEILVRFHLGRVRIGRSAKIQIERFVLAP